MDHEGQAATPERFSEASRMLGYEVKLEKASEYISLLDPDGGGLLRLDALRRALRYENERELEEEMKNKARDEEEASGEA